MQKPVHSSFVNNWCHKIITKNVEDLLKQYTKQTKYSLRNDNDFLVRET